MRVGADGRQMESPVLRSSSDRLPAVPLPAATALSCPRYPVRRHDFRTDPACGTGHVIRGHGKAAVSTPVLAVGGSLELGHPAAWPRTGGPLRTTFWGGKLTRFMKGKLVTSSLPVIPVLGCMKLSSPCVDKIRGGDGAAVLGQLQHQRLQEASQ